MKLDKKIAVVTGGAMGNGLGIVKVFLKYGARVIILDYDKKLQETIDILDNENVKGYSVDVSDKKKLLEIAKNVKNEYGNIDILVNNAGVCKLESFDSMSDELRDFHFNININGVWNTTKAFLPLMKNGGAIVNLSSVTGPMVADSGEVAYATTKSAILGFTKSLAAELASRGIRVNAIMPGYIRTPMVDKIAAMSNKDNRL